MRKNKISNDSGPFMLQNNKKSDEQYMTIALALAQEAFDKGEVPIGALIVNEEGDIIAASYNQIESMHCQVAHAEINVITSATEKIKNWRLIGCTLYVTIEPCTMCYGAIQLSRFDKLIFGAISPVFGYHLDKDSFLSVYKNDTLLIKKGIMEKECAEIIKRFFEQKRMQ